MKIYLFSILFFLLFSTYARAQSAKPASIAELATYTGADREQFALRRRQIRSRRHMVHLPSGRFLQSNRARL